MSANLIEERRLADPKRLSISRIVVNRHKRLEPIRRDSTAHVTDEEEIRFVKKAILWIAVLAVTPLALFHIITFFYPDTFMIPVAPN